MYVFVNVGRGGGGMSFCKEASEIKKRLLQGGCRSIKEIRHIHAHLLRLGLHHEDYLINMLLKICSQAPDMNLARLIFDSTTQPNIFLWNTMIRGYVSNHCYSSAVGFYRKMMMIGFLPNNFTFPFVLKACGRLFHHDLGRNIHTQILKTGFDLDQFVKTSLMSMYAKCGFLDDAYQLFDEMPERSVVAWTAIISAHIEHARFEEALDLFRLLLDMGLRPDGFSLVRALSACSRLGDIKSGEWIHECIEKMGMVMSVFVATSLVDMYAKCGDMQKAKEVFDGMPERDVVSWSAIISGYSSNGYPKEALEVFIKMQDANVRPDCFTMVGVLSACASLGALEFGDRVSGLMETIEFLSNPVLGTALIDMYAKCGSMIQAWGIFQGMKERDIVVWNAMITGLAMGSHGTLAFGLFTQLEKLGIRPDGNTFVGLLCACTHAGLVNDARRYFDGMSCIYCLTPKIEHYGCMVDLLGRAGLLGEAHQLIMDMPIEANAVVWGALLSGCKIHRNTQLAEHVLKRLIELEPQNSGNYVLLSNIYSTSGRWDAAAKLRLIMREKGIQKTPGCSWIEVDGFVHEFRVGDRAHPLSERIYLKLNELSKQLKEVGYIPTTGSVLFDIEEEEKEHSLGTHSEKLAIAFALITTRSNVPIRIVKNLRVCDDCHSAIKLISKITSREITARDNNRFHCFKDGSCSCRDYW